MSDLDQWIDRLFSKWAVRDFEIPAFADDWSGGGPLDTTKWEVISGTPAFATGYMWLGPGTFLKSRQTFLYNELNMIFYGNFLSLPTTGGIFGFSRDGTTGPLDRAAGILRRRGAGENIWCFSQKTNYSGYAGGPLVTNPGVDNAFLAEWLQSPEQVVTYGPNDSQTAGAAFTPDVPLPIILRNDASAAPAFRIKSLDVVNATQGKARFRFIRRASYVDRWPDYVDIEQADAVLSRPVGSFPTLYDDLQIEVGGVPYKVVKKFDVKGKGAAMVERWALFRDIYAPPQVTGVR